ncbi:MAG: hypothetical protein ABSC94_04595 [Polyangiaceae bacterium]
MTVASRFARLLALAALALVALIATPSAGRPSISRFDALPRPSERLTRALWLPHCGMRVIEWRPTSALPDETSPSEQAMSVIDDTCRRAFDRYPDFLRARKLPRLRDRPDALPAVSLLPANVLLDGKSARALNDLPSRFEAVAPGCCYWGLYVDSLNHLFVRNDPLDLNAQGMLEANPRFVRTFTHELSHVLSSKLGVWDAVGYDRQRDEDLAEAFVDFMGMHFPAESSADDLVFHRAQAPRAAMVSSVTSRGSKAPPAGSRFPQPSAAANTSSQK